MVLTVVLSCLVALSAFLFLRSYHLGLKNQESLFKPLTTALILFIPLFAPETAEPVYKWAILVGLIFSLAGDIFLMLPKDSFLFGLVAFLLAHVSYTVAFSSEGFYSSAVEFVPFAIFGLGFLIYLWPFLGSKRIPAVIYTLALLIMGWQAVGRWIETGSLSATAAFIGALLFIFSDALLTIHRFRGPTRYSRVTYMTAYYLAQWLIAISVVVY